MRALERSIRSVDGTAVADPATVSAWRTLRRRYTDLLSSKRSAFWTARVEADQSRPRQLWRSFVELLGRGGSPPTEIAAADLHQFFDDKVGGIRAATAGAAPPTFTPAPVGCELRVFSPMSESEVIELIRALPDKQCASDPLPTRLLKSKTLQNWHHLCAASSMRRSRPVSCRPRFGLRTLHLC